MRLFPGDNTTMTERTYMAFSASSRLATDIQRFIEEATARPVQVDHALVNDVADRFIDEMLHAFFLGPVNALGAEGAMVSLINGIANIVSKASRGLAKRLLKNIDAEEASGLAEHFESIRLELAEEIRLGFLLNEQLATRMKVTFTAALEGEADHAELMSLMQAATDGAIACFLDDSVSRLKTGRLTRGLIATARGTIRKASNSASGHLMGLPTKQQRLVVRYFQSLLVLHDAGIEKER
jgi:hypothetical protein